MDDTHVRVLPVIDLSVPALPVDSDIDLPLPPVTDDPDHLGFIDEPEYPTAYEDAAADAREGQYTAFELLDGDD